MLFSPCRHLRQRRIWRQKAGGRRFACLPTDEESSSLSWLEHRCDPVSRACGAVWSKCCVATARFRRHPSMNCSPSSLVGARQTQWDSNLGCWKTAHLATDADSAQQIVKIDVSVGSDIVARTCQPNRSMTDPLSDCYYCHSTSTGCRRSSE